MIRALLAAVAAFVGLYLAALAWWGFLVWHGLAEPPPAGAVASLLLALAMPAALIAAVAARAQAAGRR